MTISSILSFMKSIVNDCKSFCSQMDFVRDFVDELYNDI